MDHVPCMALWRAQEEPDCWSVGKGAGKKGQEYRQWLEQLSAHYMHNMYVCCLTIHCLSEVCIGGESCGTRLFG